MVGDLYPLQNRTLGEPNDIAGNGPRIGPLLISEVMYKPSVSAGQNADDYEYIEIFNPTSAAVALDNWHLADGVSYDFAAGTSLAAHGTLVVLPFNPADPLNATKLANFKAKYSVGASVQLVGGFAGHLDDGGETVQLQRPDAMVPGSVPPLYPALLEDEIKYDEASPWPQGANGGGSSLQRLGLNTWGHDRGELDRRPTDARHNNHGHGCVKQPKHGRANQCRQPDVYGGLQRVGRERQHR